MNFFSKRSLAEIHTVHPILKDLFTQVLQVQDISVIDGHRAQDEQNKMFELGRSQLRYPESKHNSLPSLAIDVVPFPIDWEDLSRFHYLAGIVRAVAFDMELNEFLVWGGDWENFKDYPHWELVGDLNAVY